MMDTIKYWACLLCYMLAAGYLAYHNLHGGILIGAP